MAELHDYGLIDADILAASVKRTLTERGAAARQPQFANVARDQAHKEKHQDCRAEQRRNHQENALESILIHARSLAGCSPAAIVPRASNTRGRLLAQRSYLSSQTTSSCWFK